ncbi:MAG: site-2 protease family protein [Oscillospiraceae bacterium]|nr:site-2 protease family protein [Oscillospiraceae bacterium]
MCLYNKNFYVEVSGISTLQSIVDGFDFSYLLGILMGVIPALICITLHELSHGLAAFALGDDTARRTGRLSLNPLKHLDPMGLLMMVVFHVGWAKPVPVNMYRFKNPRRGMALTAAAGPLSNIVISIVFLFLYGLFYLPLGKSQVGTYILSMLELTAYISIGLAVFNLLPVPPLDGSKLVFSLISEENYRKLMHYERYGSVLMFVLVASGVLGKPLSALISAVYSFLVPVAQFGLDIVMKFM